MDNFVAEIKHNLKRERNINREPCNKLREILSIIIGSPPPEIEIISRGNESGDVKFSVSRKSMRLPFDVLMKYRTEIFSEYIANFLGELFIRENLEEFANILTSMGGDRYAVVNEYNHKKFGMKVLKDKFIFEFHVSLLQDLLTEDFKRQIKHKLK